MKKIYLVAILLIVANFVNAQIVQTSYRGAFAPGVSMWTDNWTNWDPKAELYTDATVVNVTANITANTTWTTGKTYYISGLIYVKNNATLTIQPGVVVKGIKTSTGTALVVTKGAKLNAIGTATAPIVFTSAKTVLEGRQAADWGGIVLLGKASFNLNGGVNNVEGITSSVDTEYGGGSTPDDNDNSGTLKYVRIEFGGFVFSPNNEINGLTFGAVGRGTTIDNVQVSFSGDDSFEWFGGTVNCKHLVAYRGLDDDFDTDNGFSGICQFGLGIRDPQISDNPAISTSEGFESDNNAGGTGVVSGKAESAKFTSCVFTNYTLIGPKYRQTLPNGGTLASGFKRAARLRRNSKQKIFNSVFLDYAEGLHVDGNDAENNANNDELKWKNNIIAINGATSSTKFLQVNTGTKDLSTLASGFKMQEWYDNNSNSSLSSNVGLLEKAYDATNAQNYSGLDYRPATDSPALSGASFLDASMAQYVAVGTKPGVTNLTYCKGAVAAPLTALLAAGGVSLKWYATLTATTQIVLVAPATAPVPSTATVGTKSYYVSQMTTSTIDGIIVTTESERSKLDVTITASPLVALGTITGAFTADSSVAPIAVGPYVGTTTQFTYTVPASTELGVASYLWTVPSGVNIISTDKTTNSIIVDFANIPAGAGALGSINVQAVNAGGCPGVAKVLALTKALPAAPATLALTAYPSTTAVVNYAKYMGTTTPLTLTAATVVGASSYKWELPAGVNVVTSGVTPVETKVYYASEPFLSPNTEANIVNGGKPGQKYYLVTYNTYSVYVNGVATTITTSTAQLKIHSGLAGYGATKIQAYPVYGTVVTSDKPAILVNFAGVTNPATTKLYLGVKSQNGVGVSTTTNATNADVVARINVPGLFSTVYTENFTPASGSSTVGTNATSVFTEVSFSASTPSSTAKLVALTATLPAAVTTVTGQIVGVCGGSSIEYTMVASPFASSYVINAPSGSVVTSSSNLGNTLSSLTTSDLKFTVTYPAVFVVTTSTLAADKSIIIYAKNGVGPSALAKSVVVSTTMPAIGVATGSAGIASFTRCATQTFTIPAVVGATEYVWTPADGATIVSGQGTTSVEVSFSAVASSKITNKLSVAAKNSCGTSSVAKLISLNSTACPTVVGKLAAQNEVSSTEVYPNPTSGVFNVDVTVSTTSVVEVSVYSFDGLLVVSPKAVKLQAGTNTISQDISSLNNGVYFVQIANGLNNEIITKKMIKQ